MLVWIVKIGLKKIYKLKYMKNIHLIPTDKPSRLYHHKNLNKLILTNRVIFREQIGIFNQNIYITSDEEIKVDEPYLGKDNNIYYLVSTVNFNGKKIILTTDPDLIADGVQPIDDEFLEWFVKNPSCEEVEVKEVYFHGSGYYDKNALSKTQREIFSFMKRYKIIIPKEEPKHEISIDDVGISSTQQFILKQEKLEEFIAKEGVPSDEELNTLADYWEAYMVGEDPIRAQNCKKDFMMGLSMVAKRLNK